LPQENLPDLNTPLKGEIRVSASPPPALAKSDSPPEPIVEFKPLLFTKQDLANLPSLSPTAPGPTQKATTNPRLPFPVPPETPNIIVGMVVDKYDRLIDSAIIEIRDQNRHPVRAVKTNKIGQFFTATPLPNGRYEIVPEKDGFDFAIISLDLNGTIVDPLEIRALNEGPTPFK
ncbi:MAG: carboxypeptidase regulatory-like domain-containing protein, partial [Candidatus Chisholmbacteria bacterium]|nr:carboxypeptidase regulatory-like domain-containing protein [Candidatus Chisholmbacteria bacterium]